MNSDQSPSAEPFAALRSSSIKHRVAALRGLRDGIQSSNIRSDTNDALVHSLLATYSLYSDRTSRQEVKNCLRVLFEKYPSTLKEFVRLLQAKSQAKGLAASSVFILVDWALLALQHSFEQKAILDETGRASVLSAATLLETLLASSGKPSLKSSALVCVRRALRCLFQSPRLNENPILALIQTLVAKNGLGQAVIPLLGVIAGVSQRLRVGQKGELAPHDCLSNSRDVYYEIWRREVFGAKASVPGHIAESFTDFWSSYLTAEDLKSKLIPSLEKALLRAPEVVLNGVSQSMFRSFSSSIDLSEILQDRLLKPLVSNFKSTNAKVRTGALELLHAAIEHSKVTDKIAKELFQPLLATKLPSVEQRILHAEAMTFFTLPHESAEELCKGTVVLLGKEQNEAAMASETAALTHHFQTLFTKNSVVMIIVPSTISRGFSDRKGSIQHLWIIRGADLLWQSLHTNTSSEMLDSIIDNIVPGLISLIDEIDSNSIQAAQNGSIVGAYALCAMSRKICELRPVSKVVVALKKARILQRALSVRDKASFLLNHKAYSKLSATEDQVWFVRALKGCGHDAAALTNDSAAAEAWLHAYLWLVSSKVIHHEIVHEALQDLKLMYNEEPTAISQHVIRAIWSWFWAVEDARKDTAAPATHSGMTRAHMILNCICPRANEDGRSFNLRHDNSSDDDESLSVQLIQMLVLCHPSIVPRSNWINICLKAGCDPGKLVSRRSIECLNLVNSILAKNDVRERRSENVSTAAYATLAELAFVDPADFTPILTKQILRQLDTERLASCTPTDFAIAKTPADTTFVDVLSKDSHMLDKAAADYDTQRWEQDLRDQIAAKRGQQKKLAPEEQAKVKKQLEKEAGIRKEILELSQQLRHGIGIIDGLAYGPPTQTQLWLGPSLLALSGIIKAGCGLLLGDLAESVYITCANFVSSRLGQMKVSIGVASVRALGSGFLHPTLKEESLDHLVTRTLYRLRLASEQRPFDVISLTYVLPLISTVLESKGIGTSSDDSSDEQITLALEFISLHGDVFSNASLPRSQVLEDIIRTMKDYNQHYRLIKETLGDICHAISSNASAKEIEQVLRGSVASQVSVRNAALQAIRENLDLTHLDFSKEIWLACHDDERENVEIAEAIWHENAMEVNPEDYKQLFPYLESMEKSTRCAAARSLAQCAVIHDICFEPIMECLESTYLKQNRPVSFEKDRYGLVKKSNLIDPWESRDGVAIAFKELAQVFQTNRLPTFLRFLINNGPLSDRNPTVRDDMVAAAIIMIANHGKTNLERLMTMFETTLNSSDEGSMHSDLVNEAVIILYGALAQHLQAGDSRVPKVANRLLETLSTPSETVQYAVANCLPPLVRTSLAQVPRYVEQVTRNLLESKSYAMRRGAAYGLAGLICGKGIIALKDFRVMTTLKSAVEDKKDPNKRQAAMIAYELLSLILGKTFEPYVIHVVPQLITGFGDINADVREACLDASKTCFSTLSSYGVKIILPTLLEGLEEDQWRSKRGACDLLGAMAYLDPQQLASSLPEIIPPLTNVLNDTHKEVRAAANRSLQRFGEVISNPEIKSLVSILLKALSDPTKHTDEALDSLIKINFVHYLDAPSLALVVRILGRGLGDRSATKRKSAQIIGSLAHLTERRDLTLHLPILVAGLRIAVVDPVPTTRATASKALGSLIEKLGEDALPDLIPSLMSTLKADTGAGDRLGSAQALSEVLAGLGTSRLEETLPTILQNVSSNKPSVREGFMSLFIFLPACFGNSFSSYLNKIIPPILGGLADEIEAIRETALRAGRLIVKNFATKAIDLLLPELDRGLADNNYRIRLSSVELVGDLLFNLTGITMNQEAEDDESGAAEAGQSLLEVLGEEKRNRILSSLFICRNDTSGLVRSAAINVWKALVASPRTLKELVPTLTQLLIKRLASSNMEHKVIAGNALGELIRKSGEGVLATLLPSLEEGLESSTDSDERQGICIALREVIASSSSEALEDYEKTLISVVRAALVDSDEEVRETAAEAFDSLQQIFGKRAVDQVLPHLLSLLRKQDEAETALGALLTLLTDNTRSNIILPNLMPTLMVSPITAFNARAIASLSQVAGDAFVRRLPTILNALMNSIVTANDDKLRTELENSFDTVMLSVDEYDGLNSAVSVVLSLAKHDDHRRREVTNHRLSNFFEKSEVDHSRYNQDLIRVLVLAFDDRDMDVVKSAWQALSQLVERLRKEEMESLVPSTRQVVQQVGVSGSDLPGFCLPKGLGPLLKLFTQGLMNGSIEQRTQAALALSDMIDRTSVDGLKPFVTNITGPLIRVVSEKSTDLRSAILFTLNKLLEKVPLFLKPFLPQLQRTFAKSLSDTTSEVLRNRAARALGTLLNLRPRVDPLIAELVTGAKTPDQGVRTAMLKALFEVVSKAGETMSDGSRSSILGLIDSEVEESSQVAVTTNARLLGTLVRVLPAEIASPLIKQRALTSKSSVANVLTLNAILAEAPDVLIGNFLQETTSTICQVILHKTSSLAEQGILAAGKYLLKGAPMVSYENARPILEALSTVIVPGYPTDTRRLGLIVIRTVARHHPDIVRPHLAEVAPAVFGSVRDITIPVKLAAEAAFVSIFSVVDDESAVFERYNASTELSTQQRRSMQDYFKRVTLRLANQARERIEAEGGQGSLGLSGDEVDDEREIMSVGRVELTNVFNSDE